MHHLYRSNSGLVLQAKEISEEYFDFKSKTSVSSAWKCVYNAIKQGFERSSSLRVVCCMDTASLIWLLPICTQG